MKIRDIIERGLIMPQTIKPLGLIHLPGKGPNNRFDFKNKNNNRANERVKGIEVMKHTARPMGLEKKNGHYGPIDKNKTNEDEHSVDLKLPTGKKMILQAEDEEHTRGLVVTSNEDGSYDTYYWYENPEEPMAIEVKIDGETVSKDAKNVRWEYHPELDEARGTCWHGYQQKGYKKKGNKMVPNCVKEEAAGVGIITKQNTTADVKPGETTRQANKLHLGLTKKGLPAKSMR